MTEEQSSPEEQAANAARMLAEAAKFEAEAAKAAAETRTEEVRARDAAARALKVELEAAELADDDRNRRATDDYHHVYRFDGEVSALSVNKCIAKLTEWHRLDPTCDIEIIFSSPGGSIFDGLELFDFIVELGQRGHKTTTGGAGIAASMAGILIEAGQHRYLTRECWLLIHRAAFLAMGSTYEVEDRVELIKRIENRIIEIFVSRSDGKMTRQRIRRNWERKDFWLDADQALEFGLIDEIRAVPGLPAA